MNLLRKKHLCCCVFLSQPFIFISFSDVFNGQGEPAGKENNQLLALESCYMTSFSMLIAEVYEWITVLQKSTGRNQVMGENGISTTFTANETRTNAACITSAFLCLCVFVVPATHVSTYPVV